VRIEPIGLGYVLNKSTAGATVSVGAYAALLGLSGMEVSLAGTSALETWLPERSSLLWLVMI
jgi:hypothetical protein